MNQIQKLKTTFLVKEMKRKKKWLYDETESRSSSLHIYTAGSPIANIFMRSQEVCSEQKRP